MSCALVFYYGSWIFVDNMVLQNNTLSSSYTRYWLLILIAFLPFIGYVFDYLLQKRNKFTKFNYGIVILTISILVYLSVTMAFVEPQDGLLAQKEVTVNYYERADKVRSLIENNAIIIVEREDKLFFPTYKVITFEQNYTIFGDLGKIINDNPIYYVSLASDNDIEFINSNKLINYNLRFDLAGVIDNQFRLFELHKLGD